MEKKSARQISFFNMGFEDFVKDLQNFNKSFFPGVSKDGNPASSQQMMVENAAFIGTVLSHYLEQRFKNSNLVTATNIDQIYNLAQMLAYKPLGPTAARGVTEFYMQVPATTGSAGEYIPDMRYAINYKNVQLMNDNGVVFEALDDVDFSKVNISSSAEAKVASTNAEGRPNYYVLKRTGEVVAGKTVTQTVSIGEYKAFREIEISDANVLEIQSVTDAEGNSWHEVDFLAEDFIFEGIENADDDYEHVPYLLKMMTVPRRFVKRTNPRTGKTKLVFGSGRATDVGTSFVPNPSDFAVDLKGKLTFSAPFIDPQNFLKTKTLGLSPYGTTLTIRSRVGGGKVTNTAAGALRDVVSKETDFSAAGLDATKLNVVLASFSTRNSSDILGGAEPETPTEVKELASAHFAAQGRLNVKEDYIARCLSLPEKFGKIFRAYATPGLTAESGVQLFVIAQNQYGQLIDPTDNLKKNLKNYLIKFTRISQGIDILPGKIINLGIDYSILVSPGYNKSKVKMATLSIVKEYFKITKWQLNQSIVLDDIKCMILDVEGVISVPEFKVYNKNNNMGGNQYSTEAFGVDANTRNGIIFCPVNAIFEVRYPDVDIKTGAV